MKGTLVNKPNEITWALGKRKKLILTPNIFLLCPSFLHLNMFNILSVKGIWKKKKKRQKCPDGSDMGDNPQK